MPAAAVIPAPIAYIKVVAVKKLVVGFLLRTAGPLFWLCIWFGLGILSKTAALHCVVGVRDFYFEEIRVFTAGLRIEYISME